MACISKEELLKLQKTLKTDHAIGKKFGVSRQAIHQLRLKYGVKANTTKNKERDLKIVSSYKKGKSILQISQDLDLSYSHVYRIINKNIDMRKNKRK
mgnify:CR=1 FL=1